MLTIIIIHRLQGELTMAKSDDLLTVPHAAKKIGLSVSWMRAAIRKRRLRFVRIGGRVLIPKSAIDDLITAGTVEPVKE